MALFENVHVKRGLVMACAGALALAFGAVAAPDEAAAQCAIVNTDATGTGTGPVPTFGDLRDSGVNPDADGVSVDCNDSIDSGSIVDGSITSDDLGTDSVGSDEIATDAVGADEIAAGAVGTSEVDDNSLTADDLGTNSVGSDEIATGAVGADEIADNAVGTSEVADDSLTADDLGTNSVGSDEIATGAVGADEIADNAVGTSEVADDSLTASDLAANSVTASELADNAVDTAAIQDGAVTWDKLSSGVQDRIDENSEGVAIALALQNPDLVGNESFGISVNWGGFESSSAIGIAAAGVLGRDIFGAGDRLAIAGGVGFGIDEDTVGGRVGAQLSW